jgi:hypothetical protein
VAQQSFTPVEFWNPMRPNETIVLDGDETDSAMRRRIKFAGGYFRATKAWEADAIRQYAGGRVYTRDVKNDLVCPRCGWVTGSSEAYQRHIEEEG